MKTYQAVSVVVIVMLSHIILNMPNHLIEFSGSSAILNLIYIFGISLIFFFVTYKILKLFPNSDIIDICGYAFSEPVKKIFGALVSIYLLIVSAFIIRTFAESLALIYFPNINLKIIIFIFIIITAILNLFDFKTISKVTSLVLPIILLAMVVIFASSSSDFVYQRIYPLLGYGTYNTFVSGLRKYICI